MLLVSLNDFQALVAVAVDLSSFVESRTPRQADIRHPENVIFLRRLKGGKSMNKGCSSGGEPW